MTLRLVSNNPIGDGESSLGRQKGATVLEDNTGSEGKRKNGERKRKESHKRQRTGYGWGHEHRRKGFAIAGADTGFW